MNKYILIKITQCGKVIKFLDGVTRRVPTQYIAPYGLKEKYKSYFKKIGIIQYEIEDLTEEQYNDLISNLPGTTKAKYDSKLKKGGSSIGLNFQLKG